MRRSRTGRSRVSGITKTRIKLRRIEPAITKSVKRSVQEMSSVLTREARSLCPVDQGDLRDSITYDISRDGFTSIVGPGVGTAAFVKRTTGSEFGQLRKRGKNKGKQIKLKPDRKKDYFQFLKGFWIEFGTRGSAENNIPAQRQQPFMRPALNRNRRRINRTFTQSVNRALDRASR